MQRKKQKDANFRVGVFFSFVHFDLAILRAGVAMGCRGASSRNRLCVRWFLFELKLQTDIELVFKFGAVPHGGMSVKRFFGLVDGDREVCFRNKSFWRSNAYALGAEVHARRERVILALFLI